MKLDNFTLASIRRMARLTGTELTERHLEILVFVYYYYRDRRVGPALFALKKELATDRTELDRLFPHGLNSVYTWTGIPIQSVSESCRPPVTFRAEEYREVYLDHNATTAVRPEVAALLSDFYLGGEGYANPSSGTEQGRDAWERIRTARRRVAALLGTGEERIVFTGSGSEAMNLAVKGLAFRAPPGQRHIVTSLIEHSCVLNSLAFLETLGFTVTRLKPDRLGVISPWQVEEALREETFLVTLMAVNNEIGTINPIPAIAEVCGRHGVHFAVDAVQAFGRMPLQPEEWGVSLLAFSGHKLYAPKGIGGLYIDGLVDLEPLIHGGGQEMGLRSGTENVGHIMALGLAALLARREMKTETERLRRLQREFLERMAAIEDDFVLHGPVPTDSADSPRIAGNLSIGFHGVDSGSLLLALNRNGIMVSAGSACASGRIRTSPVLEAIGADTQNYGTLRFSFGRTTTSRDLDYLFDCLPPILAGIRQAATEA